MPDRILMVVGALAVGLLIAALPRLISAFRASIRLNRALKGESPAVEVPRDRYAAYDARFGDLAPDAALDERTWDDLHLEAVFRACDRTASQPGRQVLYHLLRRPALTETTAGVFDQRVRAFSADPTLAARVRAALSDLREPAAAGLEAACFGDLPERPWAWWLFPVAALGALGTLIGGIFWSPLLIGFLGLGVLNMVAQMLYRPRVQEILPALREMPAFLRSANHVARVAPDAFDRERDTLLAEVHKFGVVHAATRWLHSDALGGNEIAASLREYLNLFFLLDLNAFVFSIDTLHRHRESLQSMFRAVGAIDVALSVASWRGALDTWCVPSFVPPDKTFRARALRHPLVVNCVPNDFIAERTSILVTGSNMSGKTTFVRALGVNVVLAQALATACAAEWHAPHLRVRSSIGVADSLLEGKSYYLAEAESVRRMVEAKGADAQHLFLLDELFRGTNTSERVAAGYATLAWLNRGQDVVVVATHDLELFPLLNPGFAAYHFREQLEDSALSFDFRLYRGLSSTTNAISLLEALNFPATLVAEARAVLTRPLPA